MPLLSCGHTEMHSSTTVVAVDAAVVLWTHGWRGVKAWMLVESFGAQQ